MQALIKEEFLREFTYDGHSIKMEGGMDWKYWFGAEIDGERAIFKHNPTEEDAAVVTVPSLDKMSLIMKCIAADYRSPIAMQLICDAACGMLLLRPLVEDTFNTTQQLGTEYRQGALAAIGLTEFEGMSCAKFTSVRRLLHRDYREAMANLSYFGLIASALAEAYSVTENREKFSVSHKSANFLCKLMRPLFPTLYSAIKSVATSKSYTESIRKDTLDLEKRLGYVPEDLLIGTLVVAWILVEKSQAVSWQRLMFGVTQYMDYFTKGIGYVVDLAASEDRELLKEIAQDALSAVKTDALQLGSLMAAMGTDHVTPKMLAIYNTEMKLVNAEAKRRAYMSAFDPKSISVSAPSALDSIDFDTLNHDRLMTTVKKLYEVFVGVTGEAAWGVIDTSEVGLAYLATVCRDALPVLKEIGVTSGCSMSAAILAIALARESHARLLNSSVNAVSELNTASLKEMQANVDPHSKDVAWWRDRALTLEAELASLRKSNSGSEVADDQSKTEIAELSRQVSALKKERRELLKINRAMQEELDSARDYIVELETGESIEVDPAIIPIEVSPMLLDEDKQESVEDIVTDINTLAAKKSIVFVGGSFPMVCKLRLAMPDITYLNGTKPGSSYEGVLRNSDHIFLYTGHMAHKVSYLCNNIIRRYRLNVSYLPCITNISALQRLMGDALRNGQDAE